MHRLFSNLDFAYNLLDASVAQLVEHLTRKFNFSSILAMQVRISSDSFTFLTEFPHYIPWTLCIVTLLPKNIENGKYVIPFATPVKSWEKKW